MLRRSAPARSATAALLALGCLIAARPAAAQIQMEATVGFADTVRLGRWAPLELSFFNAGGARRGEAFARLRRGAAAQETEFVERVEIPHQGRRGVQFVVPLLGTDHPLVVGLRGEDGREIVAQTIALERYRTTDALVLALTRNLDLEFLPSLQRRKTAVAYVRPDQLPVHWAGLDGVRALVVHGVSLAELDQQRYDALRRWVEAGGVLVFAGGTAYSTLQGPRESELLPVRVRGVAQVRRMPVLPNFPSMTLPEGEWSIIDSVPERGRVLVSVENRPLIARRNLGEGSVYFLAVDYAASRLTSWPGNFALWNLLLSLDKEAVDVQGLAEELDVNAANSPAAELLRQPLLHFPTRAGVAGFVLLYLLLAAAALQVLRAGGGQGRLAWGGLALLVLASGATAWFWLREPLMHADGAVLALRTQRLHPGEEEGLAVQHAALFAARGGLAHLAFSEPSTVVRALTLHGGEDGGEGAGRGGGPIRIAREGDALVWRDVRVPRFSAVAFTLEALRGAPVAVRVSRHGPATAVSVENKSALPVLGSIVLQRGVAYEMGLVRPGETREEDFFDVQVRPSQTALPVAELIDPFLPANLGDFGAPIESLLVRRYFRSRILAEIADRTIWLGWIPGDDTGLHLIGGEEHDVSLTLLVAEVEL